MIIMMIVPSNLYSPLGADMADEGDPVTRVLWLAILASGTVLVMSRMSLTLRVCRRQY